MVVGEYPHDVGAAADLAVDPLQRVGRAQLGAVSVRNPQKASRSGSASSSSRATLGTLASRWVTVSASSRWASSSEPARKIGRMAAPTSCCRSLGQCPRASHRKWTVQRCQGAPSTWAMVALRPSWVSETTSCTPARRGGQAAQELPPERLGLGRPHVHAHDLPLAGGVNPVGDHQSAVLDPAAGPDLLHLGVQPQLGVGDLQGSLAEGHHLLIQALAEPRHLVLADPGEAQGLDQPVDLAGGDPVDIILLDDGDQGLLAAPPRLQEAGKVAALPQLGMPARSTRPECPRPADGSCCGASTDRRCAHH